MSYRRKMWTTGIDCAKFAFGMRLLQGPEIERDGDCIVTACLSQVLSDIWSLSVIIKNYSSCQSNNSSQSFSNYNLKVTVREEFDTPTTQDIRQWRLFLASQLRRSKDARRCFSGSENDWKRIFSESTSSGQSVFIKI